jgi:hypothetical protein
VNVQLFMMRVPAGLLFTLPLPPRFRAALPFAAVILPPLLFLAIVLPPYWNRGCTRLPCEMIFYRDPANPASQEFSESIVRIS